jgi:hypothetical protein
LREDDPLGDIPVGWLPELPRFALGVDEVIEDGFLLLHLLLGSDWWEWGTALLKNFLVELETVIDLHESSEGPGESVDPDLFVSGTVESLLFGVIAKYGGEEIEEHSHAHNFGGSHHVGVLTSKLSPDAWLLDVLLVELENPGLFVGALLLLGLLTIDQPGLQKRVSSEIFGRHIDDTGSGDGSGGGVVQVLALEGHLGGVTHGDSLGISEGEHPVVIKDGVHRLNPNGIDGSVTTDPSGVLVVLVVDFLPDFSENTLHPLVGGLQELSEQLGVGHSLGVEAMEFVLGVALDAG